MNIIHMKLAFGKLLTTFHLKILIGLGIIMVTSITMGDVPIHDPWFLFFVFGWIVSCITSGMPDPDQNSSMYYIWAYRTMHLIIASGTAYFSHKSAWPLLKPQAGIIVENKKLDDSK